MDTLFKHKNTIRIGVEKMYYMASLREEDLYVLYRKHFKKSIYCNDNTETRNVMVNGKYVLRIFETKHVLSELISSPKMYFKPDKIRMKVIERQINLIVTARRIFFSRASVPGFDDHRYVGLNVALLPYDIYIKIMSMVFGKLIHF